MNDLDEAINYFKNEILPLKDEIIKLNYQVVITGCIGSGKTTLLEKLIKIFDEFKPIIIKEYLEANKKLGPIILSEFINKTITPLTTQNAILDIYENQLKKLKINNQGITFYERIHDDNLAVFTNLAFKNKELNNDEFTVLYKRTIEIDKKYNIPSYIYKNSKFKRILSTDLLDSIIIILKTIKDDVKNGITSRIFGLSRDLESCRIRVVRRCREGEDNYSDEYLNEIILTYDNIYSLIENDNYEITLFNIGQFVE
jgi:deoxyadenosine/deoxycytidine kinase